MKETEKSIENELEEIKKQINELQNKVEKLENENKNNNRKERWRGKIGDKYWYVSIDGEIFCVYENGDLIDDYNYKTRNYFETEEATQEYAEVIETYYDLMDLAEELNNGEKIDWKCYGQDKYYIYFDSSNEVIDDSVTCTCKNLGQIYCLDNEFKEKAIERIGEDRLKKLFTYERSLI